MSKLTRPDDPDGHSSRAKTTLLTFAIAAVIVIVWVLSRLDQPGTIKTPW